MCVREALERLALLHRFPLLFLPLAGVVLANSSIDNALHVVSMGDAFTIMGFNSKQRGIAFTELQSKLNRSKI